MTRVWMLLLVLPGLASAQDFTVLQEFFFLSQPADSHFEKLGIKTDHVIYEDEVTGGTPPAKQSLLRSTAKSALRKSLPSQMVQYDIEYLGTDYRRVGNNHARANALLLAQMIGWAKHQAPTLRVGLYAQVPVTDLYAYCSPPTRSAWQAGNDLLQPLADSLDYLCPSIYCYYGDTTQYSKYATAIVAEAKRLARGKKVFPFVSPQYHPSGDHVDKFVSKAYFSKVLRTIKEARADGVIIWAGSKAMSSTAHHWDSSAGWWQATKEFVGSLGSAR